MRMDSRGVFCALVVVLLIQSCASVEFYTCNTPRGVEKHCVERTATGQATYVKGVLPRAGYFEGSINGTTKVAKVNWFMAAETAVSSAARFQYTESGGIFTSYSSWTSWAIGTSDLRNSVQVDDSTRTCTLVAQNASGDQLAECLYSYPGDLVNASRILPNTLDGTNWTNPAAAGVTKMTICHRDVTTLVATSTARDGWTGLQRDALRFTGRDSYGIVGVWRSRSGAYGPILIMTVFSPTTAYLRGISCNATACRTETLQLESAFNGRCAPDASPPPAHQYGTCPPQDTYIEKEVSYTEMHECVRAAAGRPLDNINPGEEAKEYHCIDYDASGSPLYVKGTYGMYGYFEGPVNTDVVAGVNKGRVAWWQAAGVPLYVAYGSATITYGSSSTDWSAWASELDVKKVNGTAISPTSSWSSTCTLISATPDLLSERCLWSRPGRSAVSESVNALDGAAFFSPSDGTGPELGSEMVNIDMCHNDLSTNAAMNVKYSDEACNMTAGSDCSQAGVENGTLSKSSVRMNLQDSYGFVGTWVTHRNGERHTGGAIYVVTNGGATLQGFECMFNEALNQVEGCTFETLQVSSDRARCDVLAQRACTLQLDWKAVRQRKLQSTAFSGGLGDDSEVIPGSDWDPAREYGVWACVRDWSMYAQLQCNAGAGEHVCFKFDEVSQTFHSWGRNKDLHVVKTVNNTYV